MKAFSPTFWSHRSPVAAPATINLDEPNAVLRARAQSLRAASLCIDCSRLVCQRTLGVGHVVSQLLLLHRTGANIWLRNVNAPLRRALQLLQLNSLFLFEDAR